MDLSLNPADAAFRDEVRDFLERHLTDEVRAAGRLTAGVLSDFAAAGHWHRMLADKGWIAPTWPAEFGGAGWSVMRRYVFESECARVGTPRLYAMGVRMVGPVIMAYGTDHQKAHYLPRILAGDDVWCQGYSEPGAGSDLASLKCRAVADGDDYVINGAKIWTTGAQFANWMFCLVRTSTEGKRQEGISFVLIDMASPGITVEPIITLAGDHELNQVFFDDVRVPIANRVGPENQGWTVAKYLLEFERGGGAYAPGLQSAIARLRAIAAIERSSDGASLDRDAQFGAKLAAAEVEATALEFTEKRIMSALSQGQNPGAAASMFKLRGTELSQRLTELGVEAVAYYATPFQPEARQLGANVEPIGPAHAVTIMARHLNARAATIYAGSSEVQRNIIAKQVLGL